MTGYIGIARMAIEVDDLDTARATLKSAIADGVGDIKTWDMGEFGTPRVAIFRTPDGTTLELIEQPASLGNPAPASLG